MSAIDRARDLRLGEPWSRGQRRKNEVLWALASVALAALRPVPLRGLRALGRTLGRAAYLLVGRARRTSLANVARVYPGAAAAQRRALVRRSFTALGESLGETVALLQVGKCPPLEVTAEARRLLESAMSGGRGVIFVSAHLGPWERVAASLVAAGVPLVALARQSYDPRFTRLYERLRTGQGVAVVWREHPGAARQILRTLRAGHVLGVPMDLRSRVPSCEAPFLGHPAPTPIGPARIALRARAAVLVGTVARAGSAGERLVVTATRIDTSDLAADDAGARELTLRLNGELSRRILAIPDRWVWMHERWDAGDGRSQKPAPARARPSESGV